MTRVRNSVSTSEPVQTPTRNEPSPKLDRSQKDFIKELLKRGEMSLRTAAFGFGTGGAQSAPVALGYVVQVGDPKNDTTCILRLTPAGEAYAKKLR